MPRSEYLLFSMGLILVSSVVLVALNILAKKHLIGEKFYSFFWCVGWALIVIGAMSIVATPAVFYAVPFLVIVLIVNEILKQHQRSQQQALLWSIAISVDKNIPLIPTIDAFARSCGGAMSIRAAKLAKMLSYGVPLPDALENIGGVLPARCLPMIRVGYETGTLASSLRQAVVARDMFTEIWNSLLSKLLYLIMVISLGSSILVFVMLKIVPSYEKIFKDFNTDLPGVTRALISVSNSAVTFGFVFLPLYLLLILAALYTLFVYLGWLPLYFPGLDRIMRRRHSAIILDSLATAAESNQPLLGSIETLARCYPQRAIRKKLYFAAKEISQGSDWSQSLSRQGLLDQANQAVLQAAGRVGNLPWAMREMADGNRRRLAYRLNTLVQVAYPPIIVCIGLMVMFIVVALFYPLITLIARMAGLS